MLENYFFGQSLSIVVENATESKFTGGNTGTIFYTRISNLSKKKIHIDVKSVFLLDEKRTQHSVDAHYQGYLGEDEKTIARDSAVICAPIFFKSKVGILKEGYRYGLSVTDGTGGKNYDAVFELVEDSKWQLIACEIEEAVVKRTAKELEKLLKKNIERFEILEEKKGIKIDSINIQVASNLSSLTLLGEISALTSESVSKNSHIQITANFYTQENELTETATAIIDINAFVGYDSFKIVMYDSEKINKLSRIRVFVK